MVKKSKQKYRIVVISLLVLLSSGIALLFVNQSSPFLPIIPHWKIYHTESYRIDYPPTWQAENTVAGLTIKPNFPTQYPQIHIEISPQTDASLRQKEAIFHVLHFKTTTIIVDGVSGKQLSGTFPVKNVEGHMISAPLQQTIVLLKKADIGYSIAYTYEGETINQKLEKYFSEILSSFRFIQ